MAFAPNWFRTLPRFGVGRPSMNKRSCAKTAAEDESCIGERGTDDGLRLNRKAWRHLRIPRMPREASDSLPGAQFTVSVCCEISGLRADALDEKLISLPCSSQRKNSAFLNAGDNFCLSSSHATRSDLATTLAAAISEAIVARSCLSHCEGSSPGTYQAASDTA